MSNKLPKQFINDIFLRRIEKMKIDPDQTIPEDFGNTLIDDPDKTISDHKDTLKFF